MIIYQIHLLYSYCQGSCFDDIAYMCQDCITPRCLDWLCFTGPKYWEGDCCCMKPESSDRCCYYRCHAYFCLPFDPFSLDVCIQLNEVYRDYYVEFYPSICDNTSGICVRASQLYPPYPPEGE